MACAPLHPPSLAALLAWPPAAAGLAWPPAAAGLAWPPAAAGLAWPPAAAGLAWPPPTAGPRRSRSQVQAAPRSLGSWGRLGSLGRPVVTGSAQPPAAAGLAGPPAAAGPRRSVRAPRCGRCCVPPARSTCVLGWVHLAAQDLPGRPLGQRV